MSKTVIIMDAPDDASGIEEIGDENPYFLGAFGEVVGALKQAFQEGDFSDPTHIRISRAGLIEVEIAKHTPVSSFMVHLENPSDIEAIKSLCEKTHWRVLDTETGRFLNVGGGKKASGVSPVKKSWWKPWKK